MTSQTVLDRVRSLVTGSPFYAAEAPDALSFARMPDLVTDQDFVRLTSNTVRTVGGHSYTEEVFDDIECVLGRRYAGDPREVQHGLLTTAQSLTSAVVRDATEGDYSVTDEGRRAEVEAPDGASYALLRVVWPISYMRTL